MIDRYHFFFVQVPVDRHSGCIHVLTVVNVTAMNMTPQIYLRHNDFMFFKYIPRSGTAGILNFFKLLSSLIGRK